MKTVYKVSLSLLGMVGFGAVAYSTALPDSKLQMVAIVVLVSGFSYLYGLLMGALK